MQADSDSATIRVSTCKPEDVNRELSKTYEHIKKTLGMLPALFTPLAHLPGAVRPIFEAYEAIARRSPMSIAVHD